MGRLSWVGPNCNHKCPHKAELMEITDRKDWVMGPQARGGRQPPELGEARSGSSSGAPGRSEACPHLDCPGDADFRLLHLYLSVSQIPTAQMMGQ